MFNLQTKQEWWVLPFDSILVVMERPPPVMQAAHPQPYLETGPPPEQPSVLDPSGGEEGDVDNTSHIQAISHSKISQKSGGSSSAMDTPPTTNTSILPVCGTSGCFGLFCGEVRGARTLKGTYYTACNG